MDPNNLLAVDWSRLPVPHDDGSADHLLGLSLPNLALPATGGAVVNLAQLKGRNVLFIYPMTGQPGQPLPGGWDDIPGARGCTPQNCNFRDLYRELRGAGAKSVFGISTQDTEYQSQAATRLHLPFALLSDAGLKLAGALKLPVMEVDGKTLLMRMALVVDDATISKVFYPVFPPDRNAADVLTWLKEHEA